jgi:hypothetical protein
VPHRPNVDNSHLGAGRAEPAARHHAATPIGLA